MIRKIKKRTKYIKRQRKLTLKKINHYKANLMPKLNNLSTLMLCLNQMMKSQTVNLKKMILKMIVKVRKMLVSHYWKRFGNKNIQIK